MKLGSIWKAIRPYVVTCTILCLIPAGWFLYKVSELRPKTASLRAEVIERYGGDEVLALSQFVDDSNRSLRRRNYVIGMLANLGDIRALPVLEKHYTGKDCNHQVALCKYELEKAVAKRRENSGPSRLYRILAFIFEGV